VAVNCAALPQELVEAELFGTEKGAYTDAATARAGLVEEATDGTLFLDEIGRMPLAVQAKLLTLLEERTIRRLGSTRERKVDIRLVAATNRDLEAAIAEGDFREDLYYRLNVFTIVIPPLRHRPEDVPLLAQHFLERLSAELERPSLGLGEEALAALQAHSWPGNVRELRNCLERAVLLAATGCITSADLGLAEPRSPSGGAETKGEPTDCDAERPLPLDELERRHLLGVLGQCDGNRTQAAELLDVSRKMLQRKLQEWGEEA